MRIFTLSVLLLLASQITVAQTTNPSPYCDASFDDQQGFLVDDHINTVSFGTLSNVTNSQYASPHYVFYNNLGVANFTRGNTYTLTVNFTTAGGCGYAVWIDFNHNNTFETSEKIAGTTTTTLAVGATPTITQSVTIPSTATIGNTRMRVRVVEDDIYSGGTNYSELPCNLSTSTTDVMDWGETEDYTINITGTTGLNDIANNSSFELFPNPSTGIFTLTTDNNISNDIEVYSIVGNVVLKQTATSPQLIVDMTGQPKGLYFVKITDSNKIAHTKRILIE